MHGRGWEKSLYLNLMSRIHMVTIKFGSTVGSLITHTPQWMAKDMGYERLWGEGAILV